mgnify:CR=1 FL=1
MADIDELQEMSKQYDIPIISIADDRSTALGNVISPPLAAPTCTNRIACAVPATEPLLEAAPGRSGPVEQAIARQSEKGRDAAYVAVEMANLLRALTE